jgi:hypothetical protein
MTNANTYLLIFSQLDKRSMKKIYNFFQGLGTNAI